MNYLSEEQLKKEIHNFIEKTGDKYIDGYELIKFLEGNKEDDYVYGDIIVGKVIKQIMADAREDVGKAEVEQEFGIKVVVE